MLPNSRRFLPTSPTLGTPRGVRARRVVAAALAGPLLLALTLTAAAASPHSPVVVVLGVQQDGRPVVRARSAVTQHLLRMGESVLAPALSSEELLCTGSECLQRLAHSFRADRLVGGEILPNDRNYIIRLWMLDVVQQQPSSIEERCIDCTVDQVYEHAALGAGKLLDAATTPAPVLPTPPPGAPDPTPADVTAGQAPSQPPVVANPPPVVPTTPEPTQSTAPPLTTTPLPPEPRAPATAPTATTRPRCTPRYYSFGRGVAVGALSGLTALGLTTAIGLTATNGAVYLPKSAGYADDITWNNQSQYSAAYALTAVTAVGLGAALIDWRKLSGKSAAGAVMCEAPRSKWTFGRGVALGTLGSLLLSGLVTSVVLTALDGHTYTAAGTDQLPAIPYQFHTPYSVGYAASAGLLVGLGLAIGLP